MKIKITILLILSLGLPLLCVLGGDVYYRGKISPYRILQKSHSALADTGSYQRVIEEWYQGFLVHRKSKYTQKIKNLTDFETEGRISYSYYGFSLGDSDSFWVKSYDIRGVPFSWDSRKKKWKNEALHIEDKYAREQISYGFLHALAGVDLGGVDPESFKFLGEEDKEDRECYLISFSYLPDLYKSWGLIGKLSSRLWVEKETFLPVRKRVEGNIAGSKYLEVTTYQEYGRNFDFDLPAYVVEESAKEKKVLESKVTAITEAVAKLRGWQASEVKDIKIEFAQKTRIKDAMLQDLKSRFSEQELYYEGEVFRWLGLIPKDADYSDMVFDGSDVAYIAGMYIPKIKTVFVGDDIDPAQAELTLFHELVHAYQDKKLNLESLDQKFKNDRNAYIALMCLIEGEAVSLELEYLLNKSDEALKEWDDISRLIDEKVVHGYARDKTFYSVYGYGAIFIQDYLKKHSWDWSGLEKIYQDYPKTMEEIMHPEEYSLKAVIKGAKENSKLTSANLESHRLSGWKEVHNDKLGEFYLFLMLDDKLKREDSRAASIGWSDDRISIYENAEGGLLFVLQSKWDSSKDASEFFESYKKWLKKKKFTVNTEEGSRDIFINDQDGQLAACLLGNDYVIVAGTQDLNQEAFKPLVEEIFSKGLSQKAQRQPEAKIEPKKMNWLKVIAVLGGLGLGLFLLVYAFRKKGFKIRKKPSFSSADSQESAGPKTKEDKPKVDDQNV